MKNNISKLINERGYKKKYVAAEIGITPTQLSNWISGRSLPTIDKAFKLADLLGVKVDDLFER